MRPRGRRTGSVDTRAAIVEAARAEFGANGYDRTSLRGIARAAEVDPRLVHHYFEGGKAALFAEVIGSPVNPAELIAGVLAGPTDQIGVGLVRTFLSIWDHPDHQASLLALVRSGVANEGLTDQLRGFVEKGLVGQIVLAHPHTASLSPRERSMRAGLIASQMLGLAMTRYVVRLPSVANAPAKTLVERLGPVIQRLLDG